MSTKTSRLSRRLALATVVLATVMFAAGCADVGEPPAGDAGPDAGLRCAAGATGDDEDGDGIDNGTEGCLDGRDSDKDEIPDWRDLDSDEDGIPDFVERGERGACVAAREGIDVDGWPCDADGDGLADYVDADADGDGVNDSDEDINGDGLLGCCLARCDEPGGDQTECVLNEQGCGAGQRCEGGACVAPRALLCSNGETDPRRADTFADGTADSNRGTYICRDATPERPLGRKPLQLRTSDVGDWHVALEQTTKYLELELDGDDAAALLDEHGKTRQVAGLVVSRPTAQTDAGGALRAVLGALVASVPGGSGVMSVRSQGTAAKTHDRYDAINGTLLEIKLSLAVPISRVRDDLAAALLGKSGREQLAGLPEEWGEPAREYVIRLLTVRRFAFAEESPGKLALDAEGYPMDDGDKSRWRVVVMGAVAQRDHYADPARETQVVFDDMSGGTALATAGDGLQDECDVATIDASPVADIIWVVDDSGSMDDNRAEVAANAKALFDRALASGLDFRVGVTGTLPPPDKPEDPDLQGKLCGSAKAKDGGEDRFLLPSEQAEFAACVADPPGTSLGREAGLQSARAAVERHLPRAANDPTKIRPGAVLVLIIATDELPQEMKEAGLYVDNSGEPRYVPCVLPADEQVTAATVTAPFLDFFSGKAPEGSEHTRAFVHFIGGLCDNPCNAQTGHGYLELAQATAGITVDVCQQTLSTSLQEILNHVIGASSPAVLDRVPITTSLAVAVGTEQLSRSRTQGFDYVPSANALAFYGIPFPKGAQIVTSYRRWAQQAALQ